MRASFRFPLTLVALATVAAVSRLTLTTPTAQTPASGYRESISGTLVTFDMVPVPGGAATVDGTSVAVAPFLIGRTEVTWDMYDVFAHALDTAKTGATVDAVARPSSPYGAPDYGWGHAGYPAISVTRQAADAFCAWLSTKTGKTYRLPTEAEWVRAATLAAGGGTAAATGEAIDLASRQRQGHNPSGRDPEARRARLVGSVRKRRRMGDVRGRQTGHARRLVPRPARRDRPPARAEQDSSWNERDPQLPKSRWWLSDGPFVGFRVVSDGK